MAASRRPIAAIVLAAGQGTRMNSDLPKVAIEVAGQAMVRWVVDALREIAADPIVLVIGHQAKHVQQIFAADDHDIEFVTQSEQLGTGHATICARDVLRGYEGDVFVLAGDGPLIRASTLRTMLTRHREHHAAATLATAAIEDPTGYGRIIRDANGRFEAIVEHRNATEAQRTVREIYPSYACFDAALLFEALAELPPNEVSGEYYLTEVPAMLRANGRTVELVDAVPAEDVLSINTPQQLAAVESILIARMETSA